MTDRFLLAETPRAGQFNHRFICSPGAAVTDEAASVLVAEALAEADRQQAVTGVEPPSVRGPDYLAVIRRRVFQVNSDRQGTEVLILKGVPTADTPAAVLDATIQQLTGHLDTLGPVAADVATRPGLLVEHPTFGDWLRGLDDLGPKPTRGGSARNLILAVGGVALVAVAVVLFIRFGGGSVPPNGDPNSPGPVAPPGDPIRPPSDGMIDPAEKLTDDQRKAVAKLLGANRRLLPEQTTDLRAYLREWRVHLLALRTAAAGAKLTPAAVADWRKTLGDGGALPVLGALAELTDTKPDELAEGAASAGGSLSPADAATIAILNRAFHEGDAGTRFRERCLKPNPPTVGGTALAGTLSRLASADVVGHASDTNLGRALKAEGKQVKDALPTKLAQPITDAVTDLLTASNEGGGKKGPLVPLDFLSR